MLTNLYSKLIAVHPGFRKYSRKQMYQLLAMVYTKPDWKFMNYGYEPHDASQTLVLLPEDEINRYCIQLYHHVANTIDLIGLDVLEVGSGRGGGADYIKRYHKPARMVGVDFSVKAIELCKKYYEIDGLCFDLGDAENLPFNDQFFDVVLNVESSHCYGSMDDFLSEVKRVLKPGGYFLFSDFRRSEQTNLLEEQLGRTGLRCIKRENISLNVLNALDADHDRRLAHIQRGVTKILRSLFREFAGNRGSWFYRSLQDGTVVYQTFIFQKD